MNIAHKAPRRRPLRAIALLAAACLLPAASFALSITHRTISSYRDGDVDTPCLKIDGGDVPIQFPPDARTTFSGNQVSFQWEDGRAQAALESATPDQASLIDKAGKPAEQAAWENVILKQIDRRATEKKLLDFQPAILPVNHWKMGAVAYDYQLGGSRWTTLLLVWRCADGSTLAMKLFARSEHFEEVRSALYQVIGSSMLLKD